MTSENRQFISVFDGFKVLRLPYKQGEDKRQFSMYIFLPRARDGLPTLIEKVASEPELLHHNLPFTKVEVGDFRIPKFKFSFELDTSQMLKELEVILPFSCGGLTNIVDSQHASQNLYVSKIFHKSLIEVNEGGTEAAAVTVWARRATAACKPLVPITRINFVADHLSCF
ncbi:putative Serpin family protein [Medicago truncatula]|nr:putative Serpin family protein [Medicago truncatula]